MARDVAAELSAVVGQTLSAAYLEFLDGLPTRPRIFESDSGPTLDFDGRHWRPHSRDSLLKPVRYGRCAPRPRAHETAAIAEMLGKGDEKFHAEMTAALVQRGFTLERLGRGYCVGDDGNGEPVFVDVQTGAVFAYYHDGMDVEQWADSLDALIGKSRTWTGDEGTEP